MRALSARWRHLRSHAIGAGGLLALGLIFGRLSGLVRELVLADRFGASRQADLAIVLLTLPDLLSNLLISGGLSAAFVPRARRLGNVGAGLLFRSTLVWTVCTFTAFAIVTAAVPEWVLTAFAPGLSLDALEGLRVPTVLVALSIPLTALAGLTGALLNSRDSYFVVGLGTLIFNLFTIAALMAFGAEGPLMALTVGIATGALIRLLSQVALIPSATWTARPRIARLERDYLGAFSFGVLASALALAPPAIVRAAASFLAPGFVAIFNYAQKLIELPVGILATSIATIAITRMSSAYAEGEDARADALLNAALRLAFALSLPLASVSFWVTGDVVRILYDRGAITPDNLLAITRLARILFLGVPIAVVNSVLVARLNAQRRTALVFKATVVSVLVLCLAMVPGLLQRSASLLTGAVVASQAALSVGLWFSARPRLTGQAGLVDLRFAIALAAATLVPAGIMVLATWAGLQTPWGRIVLAGLAIAIALACVYRVVSHSELSFGGRRDATDAST